MSAIPDLGDLALHLESRLVEAASAGPIDQPLCAEIAQTVKDAEQLNLLELLAWSRALHAAAAVCYARGDEDGDLLHDMAQRLIGDAFDRVVMSAPPLENIVRH